MVHLTGIFCWLRRVVLPSWRALRTWVSSWSLHPLDPYGRNRRTTISIMIVRCLISACNLLFKPAMVFTRETRTGVDTYMKTRDDDAASEISLEAERPLSAGSSLSVQLATEDMEVLTNCAANPKIHQMDAESEHPATGEGVLLTRPKLSDTPNANTAFSFHRPNGPQQHFRGPRKGCMANMRSTSVTLNEATVVGRNNTSCETESMDVSSAGLSC